MNPRASPASPQQTSAGSLEGASMFPPAVIARPHRSLRTQLLLALGLLVLFLGIVVLMGVGGSLQLHRGTQQAIDVNGRLSHAANAIAINTLLCRSFEKDVLLHLDTPGQLADALRRWQTAATALQQSIADFDALATTTEDRQQARLWRSQFNSYRQAFQQLEQELAALAPVTRSDADRVLAPAQERLRTLTITAVDVAADKAAMTQQTGEAVVENSQRYTWWMLFVGFGTMITAVGWSILFPRRLMRPIAALHQSAEAIAQGDLTARASVDRADELGVLARMFNTMACTIERRTTDLESQFAVATAARTESEAAHAQIAAQLATIEGQRAAIQAMSVPVLPLSSTTLMMPLIGALDNERMLLAQEQALRSLEQSAARYLILDLTGVPSIDQTVAQGVIHIIQAGRLLGAEVLLVGIRPDVAQALIGLDLNLSYLRTRTSLQDSIAEVLGREGMTSTRTKQLIA
jgi:rsbT co-antagonist protein RsbR